MTLQSCPSLETLRRLMSGLYERPDAEQLEEHLLECALCMSVVREIPTSNDLVSAIRKRREFSEDVGLMDQVIGRAQKLQADAEIMESAETSAVSEYTALTSPGEPNEAKIDFLSPPQRDDEIGRLGSYRVLEVLGEGGMGVVFRAEDPLLQRQVALKVMKPGVATSPMAKDRFLREAQATAAIDHDNIVHIYQVGDEHNMPFIAMQLLRGESLQKRLNRSGRLDPLETVRIGREVAAGLAAAHQRGLIHRDIKPDNIWIEDGAAHRAKILDFGLVRATSDEIELTLSGLVLGTPKYMAPEQANGGLVDHRCDLFSLGSVLYHIASGQAPFQGGNVAATLLAVSQANYVPIAEVCPDLAPELAALITQLLSQDPNDRPQTAAEVASKLAGLEEKLAQEQAIRSEPPRQLTHADLASSDPAPARRNPILIGGAAVAIVLAIFAVFYFAQVVFKVETTDGTLMVKVSGDNIETAIHDQQVIIKNSETSQTYTITLDATQQSKSLEPGSYFVLETSSGLKTLTDHFTIHSGKTAVVEVAWTPTEQPGPKPAEAETPGAVEQEMQSGPKSPATGDADSLVAGLPLIYRNEFDEANINLDNHNSGVLREIRDGRHFITCPQEIPPGGHWAWNLYKVEDCIIDITARIEPGGDPTWLVVLHADDKDRGVTFDVTETQVAIYPSIFGNRRGPEPREIPIPAPMVRGNFHRLQLVLNGDQQQVTAYFDGKLLCPPIKLEDNITPCTVSFGITNAQDGEEEAVSFERYAIYSLPKGEESGMQAAASQQNEFPKTVDMPESTTDRLDREHKSLLGFIQNRDAFLASIPIANSPDAKLSVRAVYQKNDGEEVVVLVEDAKDPVARACWEGKLVLSDKAIDGWAIRLHNKGENPFGKMGIDANMVLTWTGDGKVQWANLREPVLLEKNLNATALPSYEEQVANVRAWTAPGQTWTGTYQLGSEPSQTIRIVFTEYQDNGNNVRLIVERPDEPFAVATFQGTVDTSPASVFAWPVQMSRSSGQGVDSKSLKYPIPLIGRSGGKLALAMTKDGECYGVSNSSQVLKMKLASDPSNMEPAVARWHKTLKAGDRWSGKLVRGDAPAEKVILTVADVTEDGRSYRLTMQNPDNVRQFRPFVGTLDDSDKEIDGYALTIRPTSVLGETTRSGVDDGWWYLYGTRKDAKHSLRLHSDGKTLLCLSQGAEQITMTREPTPVGRSLDPMSMANDWRKLCQTGNQWRGTLHNLEQMQSVEVDFAITNGVDNTGNVDGELSITRMPNLKIPFTGTLDLDDPEIYGYALKLQKKVGGQAKSLLFGPSTRGVTLNIRLAEDGKSLIGLGNSFSQVKEFVEFAPVTGKP